MNKLKRLAVSFILMSVLAVAAFAGETPTGPCAPGQTETPPCPVQPMTDDSADPGELQSPPAVPAVDVTDVVEGVLRALSLF